MGQYDFRNIISVSIVLLDHEFSALKRKGDIVLCSHVPMNFNL